MASLGELTFRQYAVRSDGQKYRDGQRQDGLDTSWLSYAGGVLEVGAGTYDELLAARGLVTAARLESWSKQHSPFFDPSPAIDAGAQPVTTLDNQVRIDEMGLRVRKSGETVDTALVDQDGLKVFDLAGARKLTVGDIRGLAGVPAGVTHGLHGDLSSGVILATNDEAVILDGDGLSVDTDEGTVRIGKNVSGDRDGVSIPRNSLYVSGAGLSLGAAAVSLRGDRSYTGSLAEGWQTVELALRRYVINLFPRPNREVTALLSTRYAHQWHNASAHAPDEAVGMRVTSVQYEYRAEFADGTFSAWVGSGKEISNPDRKDIGELEIRGTARHWVDSIASGTTRDYTVITGVDLILTEGT